MWTAFGIMVGDLMDVAFYFVGDKPHVTGLSWRLMLGSAGVPALIVCCQVLFAPESPRWLIGKGQYQEAFKELCKLRFSKVQAARDLYYIHVLLEAEAETSQSGCRNVYYPAESQRCAGVVDCHVWPTILWCKRNRYVQYRPYPSPLLTLGCK